MKRLIVLLPVLLLVGLAPVAMAGDYHNGLTLNCSECHIAHYSQSHSYTGTGTVFPPLGTGGPYTYLLRDDESKMCLACHNGQTWAPDVFGANAGAFNRLGGALNAHAGHGLSNDAGYDEIDGHTLYSTDPAPNGGVSEYTVGSEGLVCTNCHAQHGSPGYRNLLHRGIFGGDTLTYATGTNDLTKDVFQRAALSYAEDQVDFNEPDPTASKYAKWCGNCHGNFHGKGGDGWMGGISGGNATAPSGTGVGWKRHPTADVNLNSTTSNTQIASISQWRSKPATNRVKMMDSQGLWDNTTTTVTPSCMSCHKGHGNQNSFGLIFFKGSGTPTEEGDGGIYKDLCRNCHRQGA